MEDQVSLYAHQPHFDFQGTPPYWRDQSVLKTVFENAFSCFIPQTEAFLVRTIQEVKHQIKDPNLKIEIEIFLKQEINHMVAHSSFNRHLESQGFPISNYIQAAKMYLGHYHKDSADLKLQICILMESITSVLAENYLLQSFVEKNDSAPHELLVWHAIEELDHRSIAFRVYKDIYQDHAPSLLQNATFSFKTSAKVFKVMLSMMWIQKDLFQFKTWKGIFWLLGNRGPVCATLKGFFNFMSKHYDPEICYFKDPQLIQKVLSWKSSYHLN